MSSSPSKKWPRATGVAIERRSEDEAPRPLAPLKNALLPLGIAGAVGITGVGLYAALAPDESCATRSASASALDKAAAEARHMVDVLKRKLHLAPEPPPPVAGVMIAMPPSTPTGSVSVVGPPAPPKKEEQQP